MNALPCIPLVPPSDEGLGEICIRSLFTISATGFQSSQYFPDRCLLGFTVASVRRVGSTYRWPANSRRAIIEVDADHHNPIFTDANVLAGLYADLGRLKLFLGTLSVWMFSPSKPPTLFRRCLGQSRVGSRTDDRMLHCTLQRRSSATST